MLLVLKTKKERSIDVKIIFFTYESGKLLLIKIKMLMTDPPAFCIYLATFSSVCLSFNALDFYFNNLCIVSGDV